MQDILSIARTRHTAKAYDPARKIPAPLIEQLRELVRLAPSSVNLQPWHCVVTSSDEGKARIAKATHGPYAYNAPRVLNASHVFVLCTLHTLTDAHMDALIEQEARDGRYASPRKRQTRHASLQGYAQEHRCTYRDVQAWMEKQTHIALGFLLLGAAALGLDATPIGGFDRTVLDTELGLPAKGFFGTTIVSLGYRSADDFNASLPKSRLPAQVVLSEI